MARHVLPSLSGLLLGMGTALVPLLAGCQDDTAAPTRDYTIAAVQGGGQAALAASVLPESVVVRVTDASGRIAEGVRVRFLADSNSGPVSDSVVPTGANGEAAVQWTLADAAGDLVITAAVGQARLSIHATATGVVTEHDDLSAGGLATCRLGGTGVADCWGLNGPWVFPPDSAVFQPHGVTGAPPFISISVGPGYSCGLTSAGAVYCWGTGFLGDGTSGASATPVRVQLPKPVVAVDAGGFAQVISSFNGNFFSQYSLACALTASGQAWCWGRAIPYTGLAADALVPVRVGGALRFRLLRVGLSRACGITTDDQGYCWGQGELGTGVSLATVPADTPAVIAGGYHFHTLDAGNWGACGITLTGDLLCWGFGGGIGDAPEGVRADVPTAVLAGTSFRAVAMGYSHACALTTAGEAWCWGNGGGAIGDSLVLANSTPGRVQTNLRFTSLTAGLSHTCGRTTTGETACWGENSFGAVGLAATQPTLVPTPMTPTGLVFSALSEPHGCGLTTAGAAWCWAGYPGDGVGSLSPKQPVQVAGGHQFSMVTAGSTVSCGLDLGGTAWCWGSRYMGQLGDGTVGDRNDALAPVAVNAGPFVALTAGDDHTCGLTAAGEAWCWGNNSQGQLGDSTFTGPKRGVPSLVLTSVRFSSLAAFREGACGLGTDSLAYCWGFPLSLGFAIQPGGPVRTPSLAFGGRKLTALTGSAYIAVCGLDVAGVAFCYGPNQYGQLGDGTTVDPPGPVSPLAGGPYTEIRPGGYFTCGLRIGGAAECWGANSGSIGDSTLVDRHTPTAVHGGHIFTTLSTGSASCGLDTQGQVWCWGTPPADKIAYGHSVYPTPTPVP